MEQVTIQEPEHHQLYMIRGIESFLSIERNDKFLNASRLFAIMRLQLLWLSPKSKSSASYLTDGISKSSGPSESSCQERITKV
jgi:hypothetical protein